MNYEQAAQDLAPATAFWALGLLSRAATPEQAGSVALDTSSRLRTLAIFALLSRADTEQFLGNLSRSAGAWCRFLRLANTSGQTGIAHYVSGRLDPVCDGLAAGDFDVVREIAALAPSTKQGRAEYEDDFCTTRALFELTSKAPDEDHCRSLLERLSKFTPPRESARLRALYALLDRDAEAFTEGLQGVLHDFESSIAAAKERGSEQTIEQVARQSISIEGLALLRLADHRGLKTAPSYRYCPAIARTTAKQPWPREFH